MSAQQKSALRKKLRLARKNQAWRRIQASIALRNQISRTHRQSEQNIALYWPTSFEIDCRLALRFFTVIGCDTYLPSSYGHHQLEFRRWRPGQPLQKVGPCQQPTQFREKIQPQNLDVIYLPLVGFDRFGQRLGQGGGDYDRLLARVRGKPRLIGLAYDCQEVDMIPAEPHDQKLDLILTESRIIHCG